MARRKDHNLEIGDKGLRTYAEAQQYRVEDRGPCFLCGARTDACKHRRAA